MLAGAHVSTVLRLGSNGTPGSGGGGTSYVRGEENAWRRASLPSSRAHPDSKVSTSTPAYEGRRTSIVSNCETKSEAESAPAPDSTTSRGLLLRVRSRGIGSLTLFLLSLDMDTTEDRFSAVKGDEYNQPSNMLEILLDVTKPRSSICAVSFAVSYSVRGLDGFASLAVPSSSSLSSDSSSAASLLSVVSEGSTDSVRMVLDPVRRYHSSGTQNRYMHLALGPKGLGANPVFNAP